MEHSTSVSLTDSRLKCAPRSANHNGRLNMSLTDLQWRIQDFPEEGALTPKGRGANLLFGQFFPKNSMKMKNFWARGGARGTRAPLRSATDLCVVGEEGRWVGERVDA